MFAPEKYTLSKPKTGGLRRFANEIKRVTKEMDYYSKRKPRKRGLLSKFFGY